MLAGCLGDVSTPAAGSASSDATFRFVGQPLTTLDPAAAIDDDSGKVITQLYDGLTYYPKGNLPPKPLLAEDISVSNGGTEYTFTLKRNVQFSDGRTLTADDVVYTFERLVASPQSKWQSTVLDTLGVVHETRTATVDGETRTEYVPGSLGVDALDDHTVRMRLSNPFAETLAILAHPSFGIVPEGIVGDIDGYDGEMKQETFARDRPVGTGPFSLDFWHQDTEYRVVARDDYHGDGPAVGALHWQVVTDPGSGFQYALNRNADAFWIPDESFDPGKVTVQKTDSVGRKIGTYGPLKNGETVRYVAVPLVSTYYFGFNTERVSKPVRQAVAYALNQERQLTDIHKGRGVAAAHITPPNVFPNGPSGYEKHAKQYPYGVGDSRLDDARSVLEAAGYGPDNRATLRLSVFSSAAWKASASRLRDKLASTYVDVHVEEASFPELAKAAARGTLDMFAWGWNMDYPAAENFVQLLAPSNNDLSYTYWSGTAAAERAERAWESIQQHPSATDTDRAARRKACLELEAANWEDAVMLPSYHPVGEGFYYQWVDTPKTGPAGYARHKYTDATVDAKERNAN